MDLVKQGYGPYRDAIVRLMAITTIEPLITYTPFYLLFGLLRVHFIRNSEVGTLL